MSMVLNSEQKAIVRASKTARMMKVVALAGTGKTSTLAEVAEANPYTRYLYVAYNKAAQLDAAARFPDNVKCQTSHGMVFMQYGRKYSVKLNAPRVPAWKAAKILGLRELRVEWCVTCDRLTEGGDHAGHAVLAETVNTTAMASLVMRGVDRWCHSDRDQIDWWHIPTVKGADERLQRAIRESLVASAREAWLDLKLASGQLKFSHDMYLKMAQLDGWKTDRMSVMLDEAQDTNPCVSSMLLSAKGKRLTMVGDPNQAIYEWRGATDAMDGFEAETTLGLTGSYRFGPEIAEFANMWLGALGEEMQLKGWKKLTGQVTDFVEGTPDAVLCRSNGGCVATAMHWLEAGKKVAVVGGGGEIESLARGAQSLMAGRRSEHPDLVNFDSWGAVQAYCKEEPEAAGTLVPLVRAISQYGPDVIMNMTRSLVPEDQADVTVSTQHRSKGRQWKKVQIAGDVMQPRAGEELPREELRLSYVAATRAQEVLGHGGDSGLGYILGA